MRPFRPAVILFASLACLSGCAGTQEKLLALIPAQVREYGDLSLPADVNAAPAERVAEVRPQAKAPAPQKTKTAALQTGSIELAMPPWSIPAAKPDRVSRSPLAPRQLFETASPAVYAVAVLRQGAQQAISQGSAVAVSPTVAITNCHIVANARAMALANATANYRAEVISADRATDRCFLRVLDGELEPVHGVRDYASLAVGETVYTIGSPKGLVNTLGSGLVSGLRRSEEGIDLIQISAPLSEGSSGGGLFDERGNLIGVTTFTIRDSQNLNFAIAASQFWR
jgi:serine protease Do